MKRWLECGMEAGTPEGRRAIVRLMTWFVVLSLVVVMLAEVATRVLKGAEGLSPVVRGTIALAPALPFALMVWLFGRTYRHLDELIIRMQSESLASTLGVTLVVTVGWGQLQRAGLVPLVDFWAVWPLATVVYLPCLLLTRRRYR